MLFAITVVLGLPQTLFAQTCLQDKYNIAPGISGACVSTPSSNSLNCTANDVAVSQIPQSSIMILSGGNNNPPSCFKGGNFSFYGDFDILTTANAAKAGGRDNVGLYIATKPPCSSTVTTDCNPAITQINKTTTTALCGTCQDSTIAPQYQATDQALLGSDNYHENDAGVYVDGNTSLPDNCGDTASTDDSPVFGQGQEGVGVEVDGLYCGGQTCTDANGNTGILLNYCTSWQTPGSAIACNNGSTDSYPNDPATGFPEAIPGAKSKCNCSNVCLPVQVITISATAKKTCTTTISSGSGLTSCNAGPEGLDVATYHITLSPSPSAGNSYLDSICDSQYGAILGSPAGCATKTAGVTTTCEAGTISQGSSYTCTFTAPAIGEIASVDDTVTFYGYASDLPSVKFSATSNSVAVYSEDAAGTATVTKGFVANQAACVTVRYKVDVANTSKYDENLKLSGLNDDKYGDITKVQGSVLGTDCGQATGQGTLAGVTFTPADSGAFSTASPFSLTVGGSDYICHFDAQFCTNSFVNGCFTHKNTVSATLATDETATCTDSTGAVVSCLTETDIPLTVQECLTPSAQ